MRVQQRRLVMAICACQRIGTAAVVLGFLLASVSTVASEPLSLPQAKDFYQRIITLPGAILRRNIDEQAVAATSLPAFSIFYVFSRKTAGGKEWVEVGQKLQGPPEGWLASDQVEDWTTMLVMQYAPAGQRGRVLYFEKQTDLADIVQAVDAKPIVDRLAREADAGKPTDPPLVSIEPMIERGIPEFDNKPYLMPISGFKQSQFDSGSPVTLIEVASLNADPPPPNPPVSPPPPMRIGVVFVVDTSISMQPFIERALQTITTVYGSLQREGFLDRTSFGLVGYRNNMDQEPQRSSLDYVVKIYQDLDPDAPVDTILGRMRTMHEAKISTHSFDEDAVAGLYTAVNELNWEPFEARLIFFITDAGALGGNDPKAHFPGVDLLNVKESADRKKIVIFPIHLLSDMAYKANDVEKARRQYEILARTGDPNVSKYIPVKGASPDEFLKKIQPLNTQLIEALRSIDANKQITKRDVAASASGDMDTGNLIVNELFNAQMRYIGDVKGTQAPLFFTAWAADKDLVRPDFRVLDVSVFLTRNQLNELALSLRRIIDQAKAANVDQASFFSLLRSLAASTIQDPNRYRANFRTIADSNLLPAYLELLPYRSDILRMSEDKWKSMSKTQSEELIDRLAFKRRAYEDIYNAVDNWHDLGDGDPGQAIYPVPIDYLP